MDTDARLICPDNPNCSSRGNLEVTRYTSRANSRAFVNAMSLR